MIPNIFQSALFLIDSYFWLIPTPRFWSIRHGIEFEHFDPYLWFKSNFNIYSKFYFLIDLYFFTQIATFWSIWHFALKFQLFDQFRLFHLICNILIDLDILHSYFNILINSYYFTQSAAFWPIPTFSLKLQQIWHFVLKIQQFDQFHIFHSNGNILINWTFFTQISTFWLIPTSSIKISNYWSIWHFTLKFQKSLINSYLFNQISIFWMIPSILLKLQHFDQFPLFRLSLKILIDLTFCIRVLRFWLIPTILLKVQLFWSIPTFSLKLQHFDQFDILPSSFNILIDSYYFSKCNFFDRFLLLHSHCNILINLTYCTQISTIWSIPTVSLKIATSWSIGHFVLKFQNFDWFLLFWSNCNILIDYTICTQVF